MLLGACLAGGGLRADSSEEVHAVIERMHAALMDGKADALRAVFDPRMPGFQKLSGDIGALLKESVAPSSVDFLSDTGDDLARQLELDWRLRIGAYSGESSVNRRARVKLRIEKGDVGWRIVSFAPMDFFVPARNGAVWDMISESLEALTEAPGRFLAAFDPKMPGYDQLRANVDALVQQGDVVSSAELVGSEGDDRRRSLELDWVLSVAHPDTGIILFRRHERVKCQVERQGKGWRIVALEPIEFLAPEKPR
jgi:hypothetical protein